MPISPPEQRRRVTWVTPPNACGALSRTPTRLPIPNGPSQSAIRRSAPANDRGGRLRPPRIPRVSLVGPFCSSQIAHADVQVDHAPQRTSHAITGPTHLSTLGNIAFDRRAYDSLVYQMQTGTYSFPAYSRFLNRTSELTAMNGWWESDDTNALLLYGRRRAGKSWLFRRFAHDKPAIILVGERLPAGAQLNRFAQELAPHLGGLTPAIADVPDLFRVLLQIAKDGRRLVVIDEFPYLLPSTQPEREKMLTAIQAVLEERDASHLKLILCGSHLSVMENMLAAHSGLHGRLRPLRISPMSLGECRDFIEDDDPLLRMERYSICGGMPRTLALLGSGGSLKSLVCKNVLDPNGALFDEPRDVLEQELRQTDNYFAILEVLARSRQLSSGAIASGAGRDPSAMGALLDTLQEMHLVRRVLPFGASSRAHGQYRLADPFLRFWFRYVFPFQEDLAAGLKPSDLWGGGIAATLPEHTSWTFEDQCRRWVRGMYGAIAPSVASWSGTAGARRMDPARGSEEIDIVGGSARRVRIVGECKWTQKQMGYDVLAALDEHKIPALRANKLTVANDLRVILISRSGFSSSLRRAAAERDELTLVDAADVVAHLVAERG